MEKVSDMFHVVAFSKMFQLLSKKEMLIMRSDKCLGSKMAAAGLFLLKS